MRGVKSPLALVCPSRAVKFGIFADRLGYDYAWLAFLSCEVSGGADYRIHALMRVGADSRARTIATSGRPRVSRSSALT